MLDFVVTERERLYHKEWRARQRQENPQKSRDAARWSSLFQRTGLSKAEYLEMLSAQGGRCAICDGPAIGNKSLAVDHCHSTGKVRGLLCLRCNCALGMMNDNSDRLLAASEYIKRNA